MAEVEGVEPSSFGSEPKIHSAGLHLNTINGASEGARTPIISVAHLHSTIELHPHQYLHAITLAHSTVMNPTLNPNSSLTYSRKVQFSNQMELASGVEPE